VDLIQKESGDSISHADSALQHLRQHVNQHWYLWVSVEILVTDRLRLKREISEALDFFPVLTVQVAKSVRLICCISGTISASLILIHILTISGASSQAQIHHIFWSGYCGTDFKTC
jgi:hypothetical protein